MCALEGGVRVLWDHLQTLGATSGLACYSLLQLFSWINLVQIKPTGKVSILLGAHTYFKIMAPS